MSPPETRARAAVLGAAALFSTGGAAIKGTSLDDRNNASQLCMPSSTTTLCDAKDTAKAQRTLSLSAGVDF